MREEKKNRDRPRGLVRSRARPWAGEGGGPVYQPAGGEAVDREARGRGEASAFGWILVVDDAAEFGEASRG